MHPTRLFKYFLIGGVLLLALIYLPPPVFENFPGGEEGLVLATPFWFLPIIFGIGGYIGIKLNKPNPKKFALVVCGWSILVLLAFFISVWPNL